MIDIKKNNTSTQKNKDEQVNELFENYMLDMYKVARLRLYDEDDIYDAIQETVYKLYVNFEKINKMHKIKIWLIKVLINECNKIYRMKKREIKLKEKVLKTSHEETDFTNYNDMDFEVLLKELKQEERIILTLYYGNRYTTKEIAKILNKNENTIRSKIKRAKESIKKKIEEGRYNER